MSSDNTLRSGIYVIHNVLDLKNDERLVMIPDRHVDSYDRIVISGQIPVKTRRDQIYKVLSIHHSVNDTYWITCSGPSPITNVTIITR